MSGLLCWTPSRLGSRRRPAELGETQLVAKERGAARAGWSERLVHVAHAAHTAWRHGRAFGLGLSATMASVVIRSPATEDASGYNAQTGEYGDLVKQGVIDPAKVVRTALLSMVSSVSVCTRPGLLDSRSSGEQFIIGQIDQIHKVDCISEMTSIGVFRQGCLHHEGIGKTQVRRSQSSPSLVSTL
jgi:hypothetical protein